MGAWPVHRRRRRERARQAYRSAPTEASDARRGAGGVATVLLSWEPPPRQQRHRRPGRASATATAASRAAATCSATAPDGRRCASADVPSTAPGAGRRQGSAARVPSCRVACRERRPCSGRGRGPARIRRLPEPSRHNGRPTPGAAPATTSRRHDVTTSRAPGTRAWGSSTVSARGGGLEPPTTGPEPAVLPITPPPIGRTARLPAAAGLGQAASLTRRPAGGSRSTGRRPRPASPAPS